MSRVPAELAAVLLGRSGARRGSEINFCCPSHDDRTPSASFNTEKQVWTCHACHAKGGWTDLCRRVGVEVPSHMPSKVPFRAQYPYQDAAGKLAFEVVRKKDPKGFCQRRPDGAGGWIWNLKGVERTLYRLPQLLAAVEADREIFLPEGEKDVEQLVALGLDATTNPGGAGKWLPAYSRSLQGARVVLLPDNDEAGKRHVQGVAKALARQAASIKILEISGLPSGGDVSDWIEKRERGGLDRQGIWQEFLGLAAAATLWEESEDDAPDDGRSIATKIAGGGEDLSHVELLSCFIAEAECFRALDDSPYVKARVEDHSEIWPVRSKALRHWLVQRFFAQRKKPPSSNALQQAIELAAACARHDGARHEVFLRVGKAPGAVFIDLGTKSWEVVEITAQGWRIVADSPVRFRRSGSMLALPHPVPGGNLRELGQFVNYGEESYLDLMVAWLIGALRPTGPFPILILQGEQGSAKSTAARMLRSLIDPSGAPLRAQPASEQDLLIGATHSWILAFDNLSEIKPWFSDALCRLATGGGFSTRKLFTDSDEVVFYAQRPVLLNSIDDLAARQDLVDRSMALYLPSIPNQARQTEGSLWSGFEAARPRLLGALFDAVVGSLRGIEKTQLEAPPRMADFAYWVNAAEPATGWPKGSFLRSYESNREEAVGRALEDDPVASAVVLFAQEQERWEGTATELLTQLEAVEEPAVTRSRSWPKAPRALSSRLRRAATFLRAGNIEVAFFRESGRNSRRMISVENQGAGSVARVASVAPLDSEPMAGAAADSSRPTVPGAIGSRGHSATTPSILQEGADGDASDASDALTQPTSEDFDPSEELVL